MRWIGLKQAATVAGLFLLTACNGDDLVNPSGELKRVTEVTLGVGTLTIAEGKTETLGATVLPKDADDKEVKWFTDRSDIATVVDGRVTAVKSGTATITAITADGGKTATCAVTVTKPAAGLSLDNETLKLMASNKVQLQPLFTPAETTNKNVTWSSDREESVTVKDGLVTAVAEGEATITVRAEDGGFEAQCKVTVVPPHTFFGVIGFRSAKEWVVGQQTWSDVVMSSRCKKEDFYSVVFDRVECRQSPGYGNLYSYTAVTRHQADLCPNGWRVPSRDDFVALNMALGGTGESGSNTTVRDAYLGEWGGEYGGNAHDDALVNEGKMGMYWSQTLSAGSYSVMFAFGMQINYLGFVNPADEGYKSNGYALRCIK